MKEVVVVGEMKGGVGRRERGKVCVRWEELNREFWVVS